MKINWKVRVLSVKFWLALVPAILLVGQTVAAIFGYNWDFANLGKQLTAVINAVFAVLTIVGVAVDPTTKGVSDSQQALNYSGIIETKADKIKELEQQIKALQESSKQSSSVASSSETAPVSSTASASTESSVANSTEGA